MKRPFILAFLILILDQGLKIYFQFTKIEYLSSLNFGFTYQINHALWINPNMKDSLIYITFLFSFTIWCLVIYLISQYHKKLRKSFIVDFAFAFYTVGILGNMIDKIIFGYIRDFFITPIAICNLADICGFIGIYIFCLEFVFYPKSRILLKWKN